MRMQGEMGPGPGAPEDEFGPDVPATAEFDDLRSRAALEHVRPEMDGAMLRHGGSYAARVTLIPSIL
jgi:hypothetical protein